MAFIITDLVKEVTTATGAGALALHGAVSGFSRFADLCANGDTFAYYLREQSPSGSYEYGIGTYTSASNTLSRTTVTQSSNGGSAVNFGTGTKIVSIAHVPAISDADLPVSPWVALVDGATITWTLAAPRDSKASVTITGDRLLSIVGAVNGSSGLIRVTQGSGGSHGLTLPSGSIIVGGGGTSPTLSTTAASVDLLAWEYDGTTYMWTVGKAAA